MADAGMLNRLLTHYRILELLGSGGMGEVYRARDEKLDRDVALKVLPPGVPEDDAARRRFKTECQALSRVAHPHVATLFDFGCTDGLDFLVMELVPGPTLEMELRKRRLGEDEAVRFGSQLARGLHAAHALGVVHRDIKPSNIAFTADGLLKILDFGVARLLPRSPPSPSAPTTETEVGGVAGSIPYMPPEQLLGREVDGRSDLYAVGAVLYEMVTGRRVFGPLRGAALTDAILHAAPRPPREEVAVSAGLETVILKLLDKDPRLRYQSAGELLVDLQRLERSADAAAATASPSPKAHRDQPSRRWALRALIGILIALPAVVATLAFVPRLRPGGEGGTRLSPPSHLVKPLTTAVGSERHPALSPSGRRLAFVADGGDPRNTEVFVQEVGSYQAVALTRSRFPECCVAWAPDESTLAFIRLTEGRGTILTIGGGVERRLGELTPWFGSALSFSPDGRTLAYTDRNATDGPFAIHLLALDTLESRVLTHPPPEDVGDAFPVFSPNGVWLAFAHVTSRLEDARVYAVPVAGGEARRLTSRGFLIGDLDWTPDGRQVLAWGERTNETRMWRIGLDGAQPALYWPAGEPLAPRRFSEAEAVTRVSSAFRFSVAPRGGEMAFTQSSYDTNIWALPIGGGSRTPAPAQPLIASTWTDESPQFSPDGSRIAFSSSRLGRPQIWICDRAGEGCAPLLTTSQHDGTPRWSPDGHQVAFDGRPEEHSRIYVVDVETRRVRALTNHEAHDVVPSWSRDGEWIYFASRRTGSWQVFKVAARGGVPRQVTSGGGFAAFESPAGDGSLLYTRFDAPGLWTVPVTGGTETRLLPEPRCWGHWAVANEAVYVAASTPGQLPRLLSLDLRTARTSLVATLSRTLPCGESALAVSPEGRDLLYAGIDETSDLVLFGR